MQFSALEKERKKKKKNGGKNVRCKPNLTFDFLDFLGE